MVLYGQNGATAAECDLLTAELAAFRALIAADGCAAEHAALVDECALHFAAYQQYLPERPADGGYEGFLKRLPKQPGAEAP